MGVAIKIIGFQISPYLGQVTTDEGGGKDILLTGLSISGSNTIPTNVSSVQLSIVYTPSSTTQKGVNWTSSNPSVASVDSTGLVTVVNRPSNNDTAVIITATSSQNSSIKATYSITVAASSSQPQPPILLTGLSISGSNTIPTNVSSVQLSIVYTPSSTTQKGVNWTSSNPSVASVDSTGLVTVVNRPSNNDTAVIITATSSQNSSIKATYSITVAASSSQPQPPTHEYVTDNLVQYYDAINNQGLNAERASGITKVGSKWVDIIANNEMKMWANNARTNFGQFDAKSYSLLAFNDNRNTGFTSKHGWPFSNVGAGDFTIECVMTTPSTFIDGNTGFSSGYNSNEPENYRFQIGITPTGDIKLNYKTQNGSWQEEYFTRNSAMMTSTFYNLAIIRKNGVMTAYLNGNSVGTANFSEKIFSEINTGSWSIADNGQPAAYHAYRFYDRALSQSELAQNVNYDISRYK